MRGELGESLATVQKLDVPLAEATTSSLEALQAYTLGLKAVHEKGPAASLPHNQRAIQLDPNFAIGYASVGSDYYTLGELERASEYFTKAFELREHASEREKLDITAAYYEHVTGELEKATQTYQEWIESYPRDYRAHLRLGNVYDGQGQYEKGADAQRESVRLSPDSGGPYASLGNSLLALQRNDEARQIIQQTQTRKLDNFVLHNALYALAFVGSDSAAIEEQQQWFAGKPDYENEGLGLASDTEAYAIACLTTFLLTPWSSGATREGHLTHTGRQDYSVKFSSIFSWVSWEAGSHFHCRPAFSADCASMGWPPFTSTDLTVPLGATNTSTFTLPAILIGTRNAGILRRHPQYNSACAFRSLLRSSKVGDEHECRQDGK